MPRYPIALCLPAPYPPLPSEPPPAISPVQEKITSTLGSTDYDSICLPLTNSKWHERWERLCLRPMEDEENDTPDTIKAREALDREADTWRREGGLRREEVVVSRLEETQHLVALASDWLELDSPDEGIRFDSELVSPTQKIVSTTFGTADMRHDIGIEGRATVRLVPRCSHSRTSCSVPRQPGSSPCLCKSHRWSTPNGRCKRFHPNIHPYTHKRSCRAHQSWPNSCGWDCHYVCFGLFSTPASSAITKRAR